MRGAHAELEVSQEVLVREPVAPLRQEVVFELSYEG